MHDAIELMHKPLLLAGFRYVNFDVIAGKGRSFITNTLSSDSKLTPSVWPINCCQALFAKAIIVSYLVLNPLIMVFLRGRRVGGL